MERLRIHDDTVAYALYIIAFLAIVYAGFTGNLISFLLGFTIFVWTIFLRFIWSREVEQDEEGYEEVIEEDESVSSEA